MGVRFEKNKKFKKDKNERILNIFIDKKVRLIISDIAVKRAYHKNIFIKHFAHSKNTHYLCAH